MPWAVFLEKLVVRLPYPMTEDMVSVAKTRYELRCEAQGQPNAPGRPSPLRQANTAQDSPIPAAVEYVLEELGDNVPLDTVLRAVGNRLGRSMTKLEDMMATEIYQQRRGGVPAPADGRGDTGGATISDELCTIVANHGGNITEKILQDDLIRTLRRDLRPSELGRIREVFTAVESARNWAIDTDTASRGTFSVDALSAEWEQNFQRPINVEEEIAARGMFDHLQQIRGMVRNTFDEIGWCDEMELLQAALEERLQRQLTPAELNAMYDEYERRRTPV
jgi:hypothetical protein